MNMIRTIAAVDMNSVMNNGFSFTEKLSNGGMMVLTGMLTVFGVIFIIWLSLTIFGFFVYGLPNIKKKKAEASATAKIQEINSEEEEAAENIPAAEVVPETDDGVTVAVITAAISAYLESTSDDGEVLPFRVVSFKRKSSGKPWNSSL
ncbi:MAG: OadG family protein [Clostridiales bacterium]|nr:OadG family protein [Clostridiales bacterium]